MCAALVAAFALVAPVSASTGDASAFDRDGMWIYMLASSNGGDVASIAADAERRGIGTVIVKAGDGTRRWSQFSPGLVAALHARGLEVCGYSRLFGRFPKAEARVSAQAADAGADCFVIDAEAEYEGRYAAARTYVRVLRKLVGPDYRSASPRSPTSTSTGPCPTRCSWGRAARSSTCPRSTGARSGTRSTPPTRAPTRGTSCTAGRSGRSARCG